MKLALLIMALLCGCAKPPPAPPPKPQLDPLQKAIIDWNEFKNHDH